MNVIASNDRAEITAIVPIGSRYDDPVELFTEYRAGLAATGLAYEFVFVLDGPNESLANQLRGLLEGGEQFTVIGLARSFGEAAAVMIGMQHANGDLIMTLPAYHQIEGCEIPKLVHEMLNADLVLGRRWPRLGGWFETLRRKAYHFLVSGLTGLRINDLGCGARVMDRRLLEDARPYGEQLRFLGLISHRLGFRVSEVEVRQSPRDRFRGSYGIRDHARYLFDLISVFFLVRFTSKPLRFFGMIGTGIAAAGCVLLFWVAGERLLFDQPLAQRPALFLASLLAVLGVQIFALGLVAELIIFAHARNMNDYRIEKIISFPAEENVGQ